MINLTASEIQTALDEVTSLFESNEGFISTEFTEKGEIVVRLKVIDKIKKFAPLSIEITSEKKGARTIVPIRYELGPEISPVFGNIEEHPPIAQTTLIGEMGGDQCRNANSMNYYGTISFYASEVDYETSGRCRTRCGASPALVSNNHVIARSDAGRLGEVIWTPFRNDSARLACFIPLSCISSTDFAIARVGDLTGISLLTIRTIGRLGNIRRPNIGEPIRKHGARTGYTTGRVTGQLNIRVNGHMYYGVFSTSEGFGCPGDSGSSVVGNNNDLIGIYSWGDDVPCENNPRGYFWTLINPGHRVNNNEKSNYLINIR